MDVKQQLVDCIRMLEQSDIIDYNGHCSIRLDENRFLINMGSCQRSALTVDDLCIVDLEANQLEGRAAAPLERHLHCGIYRVRPDVKAIVHSHSPTVVPFTVVRSVTLKPICHMSAFLAEGVPNFEIRDGFGMTDLLIRDNRLGRALAETLGMKNVALMRGHGNVCVGPNIMTAVYRAIYTEVNAKLQAQAMALGGEITFMEPQECALITGRKDLNFERPWRMWKERIGVS